MCVFVQNDVIRKAPVKKPQSSMSEQAKAKPRPDGKPKFPSKYPGAPQGGYPGQDKPKKKPKLNGKNLLSHQTSM